jgi:hypothetical protein
MKGAVHGMSAVPQQSYPARMHVWGYLTTSEVADRLGFGEEELITRLRRVGPPGTVRTNDGRLLVPEVALDVLRRPAAGP